LEFSDAGVVGVGATVASESAIRILTMQFLPAVDEGRMQLMQRRNRSERFASGDLCQNLKFELTSEFATRFQSPGLASIISMEA
jgi:hypothetical protein